MNERRTRPRGYPNATRTFGDIGVRLEWRLSTECPVAVDAIHVIFSRKIPNQVSTEALAYALPLEGTRIVILQDRWSTKSLTFSKKFAAIRRRYHESPLDL